MPIIHIVSTIKKAAGSNTMTDAIDTTGANFLIMAIWRWRDAVDNTVSDSKGNTWNALTEYHDGADGRVRFYYAENAIVGTNHTFTNGANNAATVAVGAFSGVKTASALDQHTGPSGSNATTKSTGSITPTEDNELIVALGSARTVDTVLSIDSGMTIAQQLPNGGFSVCSGLAYKVQTTAAAINPTWTQSGASSLMAAAIASFKQVVPLTADFTIPGSINLGSNLTPTEGSTGGSGTRTYKWYVDGVQVSTAQNPTITGLAAGLRAIRLEVTDASGTDDVTKNVWVGAITGASGVDNDETVTYTTNVASPVWSVESGAGAINSSTGAYTGPSSGNGVAVIKATKTGDATQYATKTIHYGYPRTAQTANLSIYTFNSLPLQTAFRVRGRCFDGQNWSEWSDWENRSTT